ncbi:hypothetical protein PPERSA_04581 [Pseudocohnilembus persalinus]|uniref:Transmembrane protein n=1 Tax=Pseudocohnilembus persalinus TaxID=266149 RepID=A0A0V0QEL7_PSEPJ|nr:hypothetical protein PPERSA_04581 [Pseudocohnilembus persalinus]|eukprot:KRX00560.1 hypothetical protein PPERSA_04581 [Pseudocohnilembus persalinus]
MKQTEILCLTVLVFALFSQSFCLKNFQINEISEWKSTNTTNEKYKINRASYGYLHNSRTLQLTDSKIVALLFGNRCTGQSPVHKQLAILNSDGSVLDSIIFKDALSRQSSNLSPTNLGTVGLYTQFEYPVISMGKDFMYIILLASESSNLCIQVYVLDLSDTSTYTIIKTHSYPEYNEVYWGGYTIQAYSDDTATAHFFTQNSQKESLYVQLQYDSSGELKSDYPKQIIKNAEFAIGFHWTINSILHEDKETSTFIKMDKDYTKLIIYTYQKDGNEICLEKIDINGYYNLNYYYGIHGNKGWIYLQNSLVQQGYFALFDPQTCQLSTTGSMQTSIHQGMAGSFYDIENEKILILEIGNQLDTENQDNMQSNIYQIGTFDNGKEKNKNKNNEKEDDTGDDANAYNIRFQGLVALIGLFILI